MSPPVPCSTRKARRRRSPSKGTSPLLGVRSSAWAACLIQWDTRRDIRAPSRPDGHSTITVKGNITAIDADTVLLNGIKVKGNVTLIGGGEDVNPWSIKTNTIGRNLVVIGVTPNWIGVILNKVRGNVILLNITITDPGDPSPTIFVASNTIGQNLICHGLAPAVSGGFPGEVNVVGGRALGQCANLKDE